MLLEIVIIWLFLLLCLLWSGYAPCRTTKYIKFLIYCFLASCFNTTVVCVSLICLVGCFGFVVVVLFGLYWYHFGDLLVAPSVFCLHFYYTLPRQHFMHCSPFVCLSHQTCKPGTECRKSSNLARRFVLTTLTCKAMLSWEQGHQTSHWRYEMCHQCWMDAPTIFKLGIILLQRTWHILKVIC